MTVVHNILKSIKNSFTTIGKGFETFANWVKVTWAESTSRRSDIASPPPQQIPSTKLLNRQLIQPITSTRISVTKDGIAYFTPENFEKELKILSSDRAGIYKPKTLDLSNIKSSELTKELFESELDINNYKNSVKTVKLGNIDLNTWNDPDFAALPNLKEIYLGEITGNENKKVDLRKCRGLKSVYAPPQMGRYFMLPDSCTIIPYKMAEK